MLLLSSLVRTALNGSTYLTTFAGKICRTFSLVSPSSSLRHLLERSKLFFSYHWPKSWLGSNCRSEVVPTYLNNLQVKRFRLFNCAWSWIKNVCAVQLWFRKAFDSILQTGTWVVWFRSVLRQVFKIVDESKITMNIHSLEWKVKTYWAFLN